MLVEPTPPCPLLVPLVPGRSWAHAALHDTRSAREFEQLALASSAPFALMSQAGLAVARCAQAIAPHGRRAWVAAGPGNNGGDGLVAAVRLHRAGWSVRVSWLAGARQPPPDALRALDEARAAGVAIDASLPDQPADVMIDALLGLGQTRPPAGELETAVARLNEWRRAAPVLAVDVPTGLCSDTGRVLGTAAVQAHHTVSLLTLKPGLFTGEGRDHAGCVWWTGLGVDLDVPASARMTGPNDARLARPARRHAQHKGSFGDVWVVGAAAGMQGAGLLAGRSALKAGGGRVFLAALAPNAPGWDALAPELMMRPLDAAAKAGVLESATVVCGCGGGTPVRSVLAALLSRSARLVLDADALNALALDPSFTPLLQARAARGRATVLTPHPLEAARLLGCSAAEVQSDRPAAANALAQRFGAVVVLKGSGTLIAGPNITMALNSTGNARLATPGSGDVLAGWLGGWWAGHAEDHNSGDQRVLAATVAAGAVWLHGVAAQLPDRPDLAADAAATPPLTASHLIEAMGQRAAHL
jgi:ADP-dependent NAD(P)H-hydrate dehydratase / NAD(P)H-hydrate epimerase